MHRGRTDGDQRLDPTPHDSSPTQGYDPTQPPAPPSYPPAAAAPAAGWQGPPRKPGKLTAIAVLMLISGILNCFWSLLLLIYAIPTICFSLIPLPLVLVSGIMEIIHASKLLKEPIAVYKPAPGIAVLEICCVITCNMYALVAGILNLIFWGDPQVKQYYRDVALYRGYQPQV